MHLFDYVEGTMLMNVDGFLNRSERARPGGHQISIHTEKMLKWLEKGLQKREIIFERRPFTCISLRLSLMSNLENICYE